MAFNFMSFVQLGALGSAVLFLLGCVAFFAVAFALHNQQKKSVLWFVLCGTCFLLACGSGLLCVFAPSLVQLLFFTLTG